METKEKIMRMRMCADKMVRVDVGQALSHFWHNPYLEDNNNMKKTLGQLEKIYSKISPSTSNLCLIAVYIQSVYVSYIYMQCIQDYPIKKYGGRT